MKLTIIGLLSLVVAGGALIASNQFTHSNNIESSFLLSKAYSLLPEDKAHLKLTRSDLIDVVNMGGIYTIHNYKNAVAGVCRVSVPNNLYETVQLDVISFPDPENDGEKLYDAKIEVIGLPENINIPSRKLSENIAQTLSSAFLNLKDCYIETARNATIDQL